MSPTLNGSTVLQHFERGNEVEICNRIIFDFYPGLPHIEVDSLSKVLPLSFIYCLGFGLLQVDTDVIQNVPGPSLYPEK